MFSFQQAGTVVWTFLAFMVAASLVLNLRYKPIGEEGARYLDTWTGTIQAVEGEASLPLAGPQLPDRWIEISKLESQEGLYRQPRPSSTCRGVRFAFPAEGSDRR